MEKKKNRNIIEKCVSSLYDDDGTRRTKKIYNINQ